MPRIHRLSTNLINKIAAGEVIERPGSVVKELMENSIDAGSTRIDVTIEKGGSDLIRIVDNGCGMDAEDLILAVTSHATSKLRSEGDLFSVSTMGFRGEAMASVAEISQMTVRSRVNPGVKPTVGEASELSAEEVISGMELRVEGGEYHEPIPCGCPPGTQIDVKNLFFNTPVRRKFLKSVQTEFGYISEFFIRLALANPQIHFTLRHNARSVYDLPACEDWLQRICDVEGKNLADALLYVEKEYQGIRIYGYAARPNHSRSNPKMQFLFLNGRPIRDRALQHALLEAYRGLLTQNRFPICFLKIDMPPEMVDVNVHPTKMEVRFQDSSNIYGQFLAALRTKFLSTNMATYVGGSQPAGKDPLPSLTETFRNLDAPENTNPGMETADTPGTPSPRTARLPWLVGSHSITPADPSTLPEPRGLYSADGRVFRSARECTVSADSASKEKNGSVPPFKPFEDLSPIDSFSAGMPSVSHSSPVLCSSGGVQDECGAGGERAGKTIGETSGSVFENVSENVGVGSFGQRPRRPAFGEAIPSPRSENGRQDETVLESAAERERNSVSETIGAAGFSQKIIQIHQRYIVTQCEEGLMVVDQHAMHERILYERLKNRMHSMSVEVQRLLVPEAVDLRPAEAAMLLERREQLEAMGVHVESFGGSTVLVHAVPAMLYTFEKKDRLRIDELLQEILEVIRSGGGALTLEKFMDDTLHTIACKAACKAGQPLSQEEMRKLLDEYQHCPTADHCPHGRPAVLIWSCTELDKLFCRIL